tara:strand:+ start:116 stop:292 length:177 start_codon:yes stop_codon:yes gene_type:complete
MGYHNPDLYYHNLIIDLTFDKTNLKNKVKRLEREIKHQKEINFKLNSLITKQQKEHTK